LSNLAYSIGRIIIKCHHCGAILYKYAIGDRADKNKFNGPPVPKRVLGEFDDMTCPVCGAKLSVRPQRVLFLPATEYEKLYVEGKYRLVSRAALQEPKAVATQAIADETEVHDL
jgi:hypothetical protein